MRLLYLLVQTLCVLCFLSSCATISGRKEYTVALKSVPEQATVNITDERGKTVFTGQTPTYANLPTSSGGYFQGKHYTATFTKDGFMPSSAYLQHEVSGLYIVGNALFGGVLGWLIADPISGGMWRLPTDVNVALGTQQRVDTVITPQPTTSWGRFSLGSNIAFAGKNIETGLGIITNAMLYFEVLPRFAIGFGVETLYYPIALSASSISSPGIYLSNTIYPTGSFLYRFWNSPLASPYVSLSSGIGTGLSGGSTSWMYAGMIGYQTMLENYSVFAEMGYIGVQSVFLPASSSRGFQLSCIQARAGVNFFF